MTYDKRNQNAEDGGDGQAKLLQTKLNRQNWKQLTSKYYRGTKEQKTRDYIYWQKLINDKGICVVDWPVN